MWTNYLHVLARRAVLMPSGERRTITRIVATIGFASMPEPGTYSEPEAYGVAAQYDAQCIGENELLSAAVFQVTETTPAWIECIGRNRRDYRCTNCLRLTCGVRS